MANSDISTRANFSNATDKAKARWNFIDVALSHTGDECLLWPFKRTSFGYGIFYWERKMLFAHRIVCEEINGPPPEEKPYAAHLCGNGHLGCVSPQHLRWSSPQENMDDMVAHGRSMRGQRHWSVKLRDSDVRAIRSLKGIQSQTAIAARFGVNQSQVSKIFSGSIWGWLD